MTTVDRTVKNVCLTERECQILSACLYCVRTGGFTLSGHQREVLERVEKELDEALEHKETQFV